MTLRLHLYVQTIDVLEAASTKLSGKQRQAGLVQHDPAASEQAITSFVLVHLIMKRL